MMTEDEIREWRDKEKLHIESIVNPAQKRLASGILMILNAILQDD